jgi:histidinol dehydrogenase
MQIIKYPERQTWNELISRPVIDHSQLFEIVDQIISAISNSGDVALHEYIQRFEGLSDHQIKVSSKELTNAESEVSDALKSAIDLAFSNIYKFHAIQKNDEKIVETIAGVRCWRKSLPIERIGLYIPGGTAPLFSTVLMLGIPAMLAGCKEIVLCSPADKNGKINPAILFAANKCGIHEIYKVGGAQAIAAMGIGTNTIRKVDKIFGPGNQYVTAAKQLIQLRGISIDMPAGPSEVCILADQTAHPSFIAADLLSQAEHGVDSQVIFITDDESILNEVLSEIELQLQMLMRKDIAMAALNNSKAILVSDLTTGIDLANIYAAEHLIIASENAGDFITQIKHAGSVFLGNYTPESAGDYASGTNHTLPTNGYARAYSGVSLDSYVKKVTFQQITPNGIVNLGNTIITMAEAEGLDAHAAAVKIRLKSINDV